MSYLRFTPGFSDTLFGDYVDGRDLGRSIPGTDAIEAEHFAVQMVGVAALMTVPIEELGDPEGPGGVRDDLVSLLIIERLLEHAPKPGRRRAPSLGDRVDAILLRVAESPVATVALGYEDLYADLGWTFSGRGEHARAIDMARRAVAHSIAFDEGCNLVGRLRDLAHHTFVARPDEGARLWAAILAHDPTDVWTYVQLGRLGADVGLPDLARHAQRRGIEVTRGRDDPSARTVRAQLERGAAETIEARPVELSAQALAALRHALDAEVKPSQRSGVELARELVPDLASVPLKRRPTAADLPPRERVLGALGRAATPSRSAAEVTRDLRSAMGESPAPRVAPAETAPKIGRNDPCRCGSGRKWKKCCMPR